MRRTRSTSCACVNIRSACSAAMNAGRNANRSGASCSSARGKGATAGKNRTRTGTIILRKSDGGSLGFGGGGSVFAIPKVRGSQGLFRTLRFAGSLFAVRRGLPDSAVRRFAIRGSPGLFRTPRFAGSLFAVRRGLFRTLRFTRFAGFFRLPEDSEYDSTPRFAGSGLFATCGSQVP